ncbi:hypothetical protein SNEBB_007501 [Seison nebaliae]|nr:hypothetical protein SNEBB_007501 [Seison nebaliae]
MFNMFSTTITTSTISTIISTTKSITSIATTSIATTTTATTTTTTTILSAKKKDEELEILINESKRIGKNSPSISRQSSVAPSPIINQESRLPIREIVLNEKQLKQSQLSFNEEVKNDDDLLTTIGIIVIGHVDVGKSTIVGRLLYETKQINEQQMRRIRNQANESGKSSFSYAWLLDEQSEERERGITTHTTRVNFRINDKIIELIDAPGHKELVSRMISGATSAEACIVVVNAVKGEFETGLDTYGQTREHLILIRSLNIRQVIVAVNKMDSVDYSRERYEFVCCKLKKFIVQLGTGIQLTFIPISGFNGVNLTTIKSRPQKLSCWYRENEPTLLQAMDNLQQQLSVDNSLKFASRFLVDDMQKKTNTQLSIVGKLECGIISNDDVMRIWPSGAASTIRSIELSGNKRQLNKSLLPGEYGELTVTGIKETDVWNGSWLTLDQYPPRITKRVRAKLMVLTNLLPVTVGLTAEIHYRTIFEVSVIKHLIFLYDKKGSIAFRRPKRIAKGQSGFVELEISRFICCQTADELKSLSRFVLRRDDLTVATGIITHTRSKPKDFQ